MNIMIAADYVAPNSGNFIASLIALARKLQNEGDQVIFVFPEEKKWSEWISAEGFKAVYIGKDAMKADKQIQCLKKLLLKHKVDLLHLHFGMFHHAVTYNRKEIKDVKIIIHDHMGFAVNGNMLKQYCYQVARSLIYARNKINLIAVQKRKNSSYVFLRKKWYVANGLSLERNVTHELTRQECRELLGVKENEKVCFLLGWDLKRKGLDIALKAIQECRKSDPNIVLGIIGLGTEPSDNVKEFIERETGINPSENWIKYWNGFEDIFAVYRAVDVYLLASRKEGLPYSLLEAISQETPIASSEIQEVKFAKSYSNGYFYPVEDYKACATAILKALKKKHGHTNAKKFMEIYSIDRWCDQIINIYRKVMR